MREMKDSGIPWVGEIPKNWEIIKGKYILIYLQRPILSTDKVITCFRDGEVTLRSNRREDGFTISEKEIGYQGIDVGDLVVHGMDGFAGSIGISDSRGKASPVLNVLNSSQDKKFLMYYLRSMAYNNVFLALSTGIRVRSCDLNWNKLANLPYAIPPIDEQHRIANFLDSKCSKIDSIRENVEAEIEALKQYKQSVITEAVTKGLDKNVEMKDSGIPWIGEIPKNWEIMPNKYLMHKVKKICPVYNGENILSLTIQGVIIRDFDLGGKMPATFDGYQIIYPGNLLMCLFDYDVTPRCIGLIKDKGLTSPAYSQFVMNQGADARYYYYYYLLLDFTKELLHLAKNLRHSFTEEQLGKIKVPVPPIEEQHCISDYLDTKCAKIDSIIQKKQELLANLDTYKKSLIYEYVTGKKEVPAV
jgi:type I restriction enzyme S subunit